MSATLMKRSKEMRTFCPLVPFQTKERVRTPRRMSRVRENWLTRFGRSRSCSPSTVTDVQRKFGVLTSSRSMPFQALRSPLPKTPAM